ncbi:MAG: transglutaminase-like domain-containing protein, partial [Lachnospiraceae bacterium]|nr:transglutaminase-like domain-containing protein [Lachnospiraceae bacterium]
MKRNKGKNINKALSLVLSLSLVCSMFTGFSLSAFAAEDDMAAKYKGDYKAPVVIEEDITQEEFNDDLTEESLNDIVNSFKATDSYWSQFSEPYYNYVDGMTDAQKELYNKLYAVLYELIDGGSDLTEYNKKHEQYLTLAVTQSGVSKQEAQSVAYVMLYEHPELYYLETLIKVSSTDEGDISVQLGVYPDFKDASERESASATIRSSMDSYLSQISADTDYDKEKQIHDLICDNVRYTSGASYNQTMASVFLEGKSVCAGYSEAFAALCNACGISAMSVTSAEHEWSQVYLDGYW